MTRCLPPCPQTARSMMVAADPNAPTRLDIRGVAAARKVPDKEGSIDRTDRHDSPEQDSTPAAGMARQRWFAAIARRTVSVLAIMARHGHDNVIRQFHELDLSAELESKSLKEGEE